MNKKTGAGPGRPRPRRRALALAAVLAGIGLLAAACGGSGSPSAGSSGSPGGLTVPKLDSFAACMRSHGVANFYPSKRTGTPTPNGSQVVLSFGDYIVAGVDPSSPQFQAGMKACHHLLGLHPTPQGLQHQQLAQMLKSAACMRSHGYPDWPDPSTGSNGQGVFIPGPPAGVDTSSPQFQKTAKACGESVP